MKSFKNSKISIPQQPVLKETMTEEEFVKNLPQHLIDKYTWNPLYAPVNGIRQVMTKSKTPIEVGWLDSNGNEYFIGKYKDVSGFQNGYATIEEKGGHRKGYIDLNWKVHKFYEYNSFGPFRKGYAEVELLDESEGYYNTDFEFIPAHWIKNPRKYYPEDMELDVINIQKYIERSLDINNIFTLNNFVKLMNDFQITDEGIHEIEESITKKTNLTLAEYHSYYLSKRHLLFPEIYEKQISVGEIMSEVKKYFYHNEIN